MGNPVSLQGRSSGRFAICFLAVMLNEFCGFVSHMQIRAHAQTQTGEASGEGAQSKYALLIGINHYLYPDRVSPLEGSLNDVQDMRQVLIGKFNFPPENITILTDAQATHAGTIAAIKSLIARVHTGDIVVIHFSGHGSQMPDVTGTMISGLDETIVPYDSRDSKGQVFDISGGELHPLWVQLAAKTQNVTYILDSCHSGTLVRGARVRGIAADTREFSPAAKAALVAASRGVGAAETTAAPRFAFISAASPRESAFEHSAEGTEHGALTYFLTRELRNTGAGATYRDVMDRVIGNVAAYYPNQHVSLEGAEQNQYVFGDRSSLAHTYVVASPSYEDPGRVALAIGKVEGATVGSVFEVYPPGSKMLAPPEKSLARVRLTKVNALDAEAAVVDSNVKIPAASRAIERQHRFGTSRMRVFFDGPPDSPTLQAIKDRLQNVPYIEVVDKPTLCNMQVREEGGFIKTLGADSTTRSTPVVTTDPSVTDRVVDQLKKWARWFAVLSIRNAQSEIKIGFRLQDSRTRDPMAQVGRPDMGVPEGEIVDALLTNAFDRDLYVAMLDLDSDGSISVVYPPEGAKPVLTPGSTVDQKLKTFIPTRTSQATDVLMAFASVKPIDLRPLIQPKISREVTSDPLQQLLNDSGSETRGLAPVSNAALDLGSWTTAQRVLVVKKVH